MAQDKDQILLDAFNLPPEEAIKFFESKGYKISFNHYEMKREAHTKAFTVAGVIQMDVLKDIHQSILKGQQQGTALSQFKADIIPTLISKGWYEKKVVQYQGKEKTVDLSAPWRLKLIYNVNMRTSMMAGRYKAMTDAALLRPYWRYRTVGDAKVRDEHARLNGKIFHHKDRFWDKYYPPNGWNCRCSVDSVSKSEFNRKNMKLDYGDDPENKIVTDDGWDYNPAKKDFKPDYSSYPPKMASKLKELEPADNVKLIDRLPDPTPDVKIKLLKKHEKELVRLDREEAVVITKSGNVYQVAGDKKSVDITALGSSLKGAYVTHNHIDEETEFTMSDRDFATFIDNEIECLRGVDYKYIYELTRNPADIDIAELEKLSKLPAAQSNEELANHLKALIRAKELGIGLKRSKND
jgi:SPP1 gp7 family putative phage head morphogenesis protein